jgi:hypothetical protein
VVAVAAVAVVLFCSCCCSPTGGACSDGGLFPIGDWPGEASWAYDLRNITGDPANNVGSSKNAVISKTDTIEAETTRLIFDNVEKVDPLLMCVKIAIHNIYQFKPRFTIPVARFIH